jgi:hypothetical protein
MDEDAILLAIGKLQGQMEGLGREMKSLKEAIFQNSESTQDCVKTLNDRVAYLELNGAKISQTNAANLVLLERRVEKIEKKIGTEGAVDVAKKHWIDSFWAKAGIIITVGITILNFVKDNWPFS